MEADERTLKAAIYGLNRAGGRTRKLDEAWITGNHSPRAMPIVVSIPASQMGVRSQLGVGFSRADRHHDVKARRKSLQMLEEKELGGRDSNPDTRLQRPQSYR
jgi:hypothetical protein